MSASTRIAAATRGEHECWPWPSADPDGYGRVYFEGRQRPAHRVAYGILVGPIPAGMTLDHTCHTADAACVGGTKCPHRRCVNPGHLEPVSAEENSRRQVKARKTHCINGHVYDDANTGRNHGRRTCRACHTERQRAFRLANPDCAAMTAPSRRKKVTS
jgi:hypothetical protein